MSVSEYFTDEDLETQIRLQFEYDEMWDFDFKAIFSSIVDRGGDFFLEFRGRCFSIDKITGVIVEVT